MCTEKLFCWIINKLSCFINIKEFIKYGNDKLILKRLKRILLEEQTYME